MLQEFLNYLNSKVGISIYVWGGQGQKGSQITEAWIKKKENSTENFNRAMAFWAKMKKKVDPSLIEAYDCSGLGVYWLYNLKKLIKGDHTADSLMKAQCTKISRSQVKKGDWVFKVNSAGRATHIGYVVDDALNVVESKGRDWGVIKSHISKSSWNAFGRPKMFKDEIESGTPSTSAPAPATPSTPAPSTPDPTTPAPSASNGVVLKRLLKLTSPMMRGEDVKAVQNLLVKAGHSVGAIDGIFGSKTKAAVVAFQKKNGLTADGIVGAKTIAKLGGSWR